MTNAYDRAFPSTEKAEGAFNPGMTKREYFAAMALQGLCASDNFDSRYPSTTAEIAKGLADALVKELSK